MRSISSLLNPESLLIVILFSLPVLLSLALMFIIPLASMSKVTSICGCPLRAGAIPSKLNSPNSLLCCTSSRSPWNTLIVTAGWLSSAVENVCCPLVGIVVFFWMILVITPPSVSIPKLSGVTSNNRTSLRSPPNTAPWIAAPTATASSGLTSLRGALPNSFSTSSWTLGIRVCPPTRITSSISAAVTPASFIAMRQGSNERWIKSSTRDSSFDLVIFTTKCFGPEASAVI